MPGSGSQGVPRVVSPDVAQLFMDQPDFDLGIPDLGGIEGEQILATTPPELPYVADTDVQQQLHEWKLKDQMLFAEYVPKPKPKPLTKEEKKPLKLSEEESKYIGYLFERDPKTADFLRKAATLVADVEQEIPDPAFTQYPLEAIEGDALLDDVFPEEEYAILESSPEVSPEVTDIYQTFFLYHLL